MYIRNVVSIVFYMLRSILKGLKLSYSLDQTYTYTKSSTNSPTNTTKTNTTALSSKWKKIGHSIHFISCAKQDLKKDIEEPPLKKTGRHWLNNKLYFINWIIRTFKFSSGRFSCFLTSFIQHTWWWSRYLENTRQYIE